jgi:hypothetical protein
VAEPRVDGVLGADFQPQFPRMGRFGKPGGNDSGIDRFLDSAAVILSFDRAEEKRNQNV